ncbi:hypothetical protein JL722_4317 [Aureococcus anophagefferens]|nr:hypothetical protein JL722_4317 [Aureococcus anophagefferens]
MLITPRAARATDCAHKDGNLHSLNVFLNGRAEDGGSGGAQFAGGGLFLADGPEVDGVEVWTDEFLDAAAGVFARPQRTGAAVVHDNTVWHGIAPLASGSKYSLLLFADMTDEQIDGDRATTAAFANDGAAPLALSWCGTAAEEGDCVAVATIAPGATEFQDTYADRPSRRTPRGAVALGRRRGDFLALRLRRVMTRACARRRRGRAGRRPPGSCPLRRFEKQVKKSVIAKWTTVGCHQLMPAAPQKFGSTARPVTASATAQAQSFFSR